MIKAVQQFALRSVLSNDRQARETLAAVKAAGYDGIELCDFLLRKLPLSIRIMTKLAGMGIGSCGKLDWDGIIAQSGLQVVSIHTDLGSIEKSPDAVAATAKRYGTNNVVITGMYSFDYSSRQDVMTLARRLSMAGKILQDRGIQLIYHNHNCEYNKIDGKYALELLLENTDKDLVGFEFDSFWTAETGCDPVEIMDMLGSRMKLYHINDRGVRIHGKKSSILKSDSLELGTGCMPLERLIEKAKSLNVQAIILEGHRNWIDNDPVKSMQISGEFLNSKC